VIGATKNYRERGIPLIDSVCEMLKSKELRCGSVFVDEKKRPVTYNSACGRLDRLCKRVGLRNIGWHALRHTFASTLANGGAQITAIQQLLGHSSVETTMRYAHVDDQALREAVKALDR
jgi:site-specific recombinase XerD